MDRLIAATKETTPAPSPFPTNPVSVPSVNVGPLFPTPRPNNTVAAPVANHSTPSEYCPAPPQHCVSSGVIPEIKSAPLPPATSECYVEARVNLPGPSTPPPVLG